MTRTCLPRTVAALAFVVLFCQGISYAQTVADAARESRAKREAGTKANNRVFTNKDEPGSIPPVAPPPPILEPIPNAAVTARHEVMYDPYEGSVQRIIINVTLNGRTQARLAVDTGAHQTIIFPGLAQRLGFLNDTSAGVKTFSGGIGGNVPAVAVIIDTIRVGDVEQPFFPAKIVPAVSSAFEGLIGMDFLSLFLMHIDPLHHLLILEDVVPTSTLYGQRNEQWWRTNFKEFADLRRGWRDYAEDLSKTIESSNITAGGGIEEERLMLDFARNQVLEAERMFNRLNRRAIEYLVPTNWREY